MLKKTNRIVYFKGITPVMIFTLALLLTACGAQNLPQTLENKQWNLISFGPTTAEIPLVKGSTITLSFVDGKLSGSGGCNSYGGEFQVQGTEITFSNINSTLMACADENVTKQEQQYFQALQEVRSFELTDNHLYLNDSKGQHLLTFDASSFAPTTPTTYP